MGLPALPKILLVDDEPELPPIMENLLTGLCVVDGVTNGGDALEAVGRRMYPVAIVDLHFREVPGLPNMQGLEILAELGRRSPFTKTIILTGQPTMESAIAALNLGVFRYLQKPLLRDPLRQCLQEALDAYEVGLQAHDRSLLNREHLERFGLTPRLAEVAEAVIRGERNEDIAKRLAVTERTVEKHVERVLGHFQLRSRFLIENHVRGLMRDLRQRPQELVFPGGIAPEEPAEPVA